MSGRVDEPRGIFRRTVRRMGLAALLLPVFLGACGGPSDEVHRFNQMGLEHYQSGRYYDALAMFERAREEDRETPEPAYYIGCCYLKLADQKFREDSLVSGVRYCDTALKAFTAAYEAFPGYTNALAGKTEALKRKGEGEAALALADWAASACGPRAKMHIFRAREYAQHGDVDKALAIFQEAVRVEPRNPATHVELGRFYARFDKRAEAMSSLKRAYELDPNAPGVEAALASLESSSGSAMP